MTRKEAMELIEFLVDEEPEIDELAAPDDYDSELWREATRDWTPEETRAYYAEKLDDCLNVWDEDEIEEARALGLDVSSVA